MKYLEAILVHPSAVFVNANLFDMFIRSELLQVRHAAFQLALVSQAVAEDEENAAVGQDLADSGIINRSDDDVVQLDCTNPACGVRYIPLTKSSVQKARTLPDKNTELYQCSACNQPACVACITRQSVRSNSGIPKKEAIVLCKRYARTS